MMRVPPYRPTPTPAQNGSLTQATPEGLRVSGTQCPRRPLRDRPAKKRRVLSFFLGPDTLVLHLLIGRERTSLPWPLIESEVHQPLPADPSTDSTDYKGHPTNLFLLLPFSMSLLVFNFFSHLYSYYVFAHFFKGFLLWFPFLFVLAAPFYFRTSPLKSLHYCCNPRLFH